MLKVGLTGGIASGKSTIAEMFRRFGAHVIDADQIARQVVEPGRPALQEIAGTFGEGVLRPDGTLDRAALARIVFRDPEARARLNAIVHPRLWEEEGRQIEAFEAQDPEGIVVLDAAVLIEAGCADRMDVLVVLDVDEEDQLMRLASMGVSREEGQARIGAQMPTAEKLAHADYVIENRGSLEETGRQAERIWRQLLVRAREKVIDKK
ncbi:MAG: dephospho-CoA kinase [Nitrospinota bacterium]